MKIAIIGTGNVGSTLAYALVLKGVGNHLVLANRNITKAQGDALDLQHTLAFCQRPMQIESNAIDQVHDSDIVVVTASVPLSNEMSTRLELGPANVNLFRQLIPTLSQQNPRAIFIIVTNPVDILTYLTTQLSGFPATRVLGIGTLIDSARFRALLSVKEQIHPDDLRAYILGEHGPNQFPVFSHASAGGEQIIDNPTHREIFNEVSDAGFDVYKLKGYTNYAIAAATCEVIQSIVYDDHRTMPLSTYFDEWQGIQDNCFSIPVVVGRVGIIRHLHPDLNPREIAALKKTAALVKSNLQTLL
ncbi:lactate/malate dehydrogenase family protein [Methylomarinum sp. Ch1-1]|uniref:Lactate/malate dehydrogenase family protein n=1 Tax=Methylomarinum roseum TaxID=3067653 RepID=A0AAU7NTL1_9GAMM|nr:lactate/malate dehydrogenase family protein [Methylomarinum sp. Ch1-1]MDP4519668.1 lactate/malate dehydrogenase family protein [Methylomarinum sp. Ch1-1]